MPVCAITSVGNFCPYKNLTGSLADKVGKVTAKESNLPAVAIDLSWSRRTEINLSTITLCQ